MKELMGSTPILVHVGLFLMFILISFFIAFASPLVAFAVGAFVFMCFIHNAVNMPAIRCTEDPLYGEDPCGFFDQKVKFTFLLWAVGVIAIVLIFIVTVGLLSFMVNAGLVYTYEVPKIDIISSIFLLAISLVPFIPATFVLMKASYRYDGRTMTWITFIYGIVAVCVVPSLELMFLKSAPPDYVPAFHTFEIFPYLPLSICALAVSLVVTFYLSKSAKKSFIEYIESDKE